VSIELAKTQDSEDINSFDFDIYRRKPGSDTSNPYGIYDIEGLLDVPGLFGPDYCRSFSGKIKDSLQSISANELKIKNTDISVGLDYTKTLLQPKWSNVQFLKYLKTNLIGKNNECGYKAFIKRQNMKSYFVFKSLNEMIDSPVAYKFMLSDRMFEDRLPIFSFYIFDNYKLNGVFASKRQAYSYFDYDTGTFVEGSEAVEDYKSLTDFYLIDKDDLEDSNAIIDTGTNNEFTNDFAGRVKGSYYNRLTNLVKMWINTEGLPNATPGQTVEIFFPHGMQAEALYSFQYSGYWLIEKVVHNLGDNFYTKLLLTRHGLDTDKETTLLSALSKKK